MFPKMQCDFCDKLITGDHGLVIDGEMTYHGFCWLELTEKFPKVVYPEEEKYAILKVANSD